MCTFCPRSSFSPIIPTFIQFSFHSLNACERLRFQICEQSHIKILQCDKICSDNLLFPQLLLFSPLSGLSKPGSQCLKKGGGGDSTKMWLMSPSSTVLEHKQDVFIRPIAAPRILKIAEAGAAHSWKTMQDHIKLQTCMLLKQCSTIIKGYTSSSARVLMISW